MLTNNYTMECGGRSMLYRLPYRVAPALLCICVISGCARPKDANITAFANATSALTAFAKDTGDLNVDIDGRIKLAMAAHKAIAATNTDFPAEKGVLITGQSDADWEARAGLENLHRTISGVSA
jgi:hypothetical protein